MHRVKETAARVDRNPGRDSSTLSGLTPALTILLALVLLCGCSVVPGSDGPGRLRIAFREARDGAVSFTVLGFDAAAVETLKAATFDQSEWNRLFSIYVDIARTESDQTPPVLGSYEITGEGIRFTPRFDLEPGLTYRAVFDPAGLPNGLNRNSGRIIANVTRPKPERLPSTVVEHVYPTTDVLPENQLKFYIHFSDSMGRGYAYDNIHLLDSSGREVEAAFLVLFEELWDPERKRFTLFFDPGRVKRELGPHLEAGRALVPGRSYTLVIDSGWPDAHGLPLLEGYRKEFRAVAPDYSVVDPKEWAIRTPAAGTRDPLALTFPEPLDRAILERGLWITASDGSEVEGRVEVSAGETQWRFIPEGEWKLGGYNLVADRWLEDLAGNRIGRPFEVDVFNRVEREVQTETVSIAFEVGAAEGSAR